MADSDGTTNQGNDSGKGGEGTSTEGKSAAEIKKIEDAPKWLQDELSRARDDAAKYRTRLRDAKSEVEAEVRSELSKEVDDLKTEVSDLKGKLTIAESEGLKLDAALAVGVPGEHLKAFAERLKGTTLDELKADAETAKKMFGAGTSRATDSSAGLGDSSNVTPESAFGEFVKKSLKK